MNGHRPDAVTGPPGTAARSHEGDGVTVRDGAHCRLRVPRGNRGMTDEVPDEPSHLSVNADRVFRPREGVVPEEPHVMPCGHRRTGQTPFCDHDGTRADPHRGGP